MKPVPMKFGEYVWHHNPQNISFECDRSVAEMKSPFGKEVLSVPSLPSVYAVFEKLEIKGEPKPNVLEYSFVFREVMEKKQKTVITYFDCENGQTLWDIAYKTGVKIDELVRLNPDVKFPDENLGTRRVKLC